MTMKIADGAAYMSDTVRIVAVVPRSGRRDMFYSIQQFDQQAADAGRNPWIEKHVEHAEWLARMAAASLV